MCLCCIQQKEYSCHLGHADQLEFLIAVCDVDNGLHCAVLFCKQSEHCKQKCSIVKIV